MSSSLTPGVSMSTPVPKYRSKHVGFREWKRGVVFVDFNRTKGVLRSGGHPGLEMLLYLFRSKSRRHYKPGPLPRVSPLLPQTEFPLFLLVPEHGWR